MHVNGQAVIKSWFIFLWFIYNGIFACFLQGRCTFLLAKTSRSQQIRARVEEGWMMSSTNPGGAEKREEVICIPDDATPTCAQPGHHLWNQQCELGPTWYKRGCFSGRSPTTGLGAIGKKKNVTPSLPVNLTEKKNTHVFPNMTTTIPPIPVHKSLSLHCDTATPPIKKTLGLATSCGKSEIR